LEVLAGLSLSLQKPAPLKWISRVCLWADPRRDKLFLRLGFGPASLLRDLLLKSSRSPFLHRKEGVDF
jgi:hypothetical protein